MPSWCRGFLLILAPTLAGTVAPHPHQPAAGRVSCCPWGDLERGEEDLEAARETPCFSLPHQALASSCGSAIGVSPWGTQWAPRTRIPPQAKGGSSWPRHRARLRATFELCGGLAVTHLEAPYHHGAWVSLRKGRGTRVGNGVIPARQLGGIWLQSQMACGGPERTGRAEIAFQGAGPGRGRGSSTPSGWSRTPW